MAFSDNLIRLRHAQKLTQQELADAIGVSKRTITGYETDHRYPKQREIYTRLAGVLHCTENDLLSDSEQFVTEAQERYGYRGKKQALEMAEQITGMYAGGEISEDDLGEVIKMMMDVFWKAKEENKKYTPRKYQKKE